MIEVQFNPEMECRIRGAAQEQHVSESLLINEVVLRWLEDREDHAAGMRALCSMKYSVSQQEVSQQEMERRSDGAG